MMNTGFEVVEIGKNTAIGIATPISASTEIEGNGTRIDRVAAIPKRIKTEEEAKLRSS
jgi:hypothetical protein